MWYDSEGLPFDPVCPPGGGHFAFGDVFCVTRFECFAAHLVCEGFARF
jgi:hypothetical protein